MALNLDIAIDACLIELREYNKQAYGDLILTCTDNISFKIIDAAITDEHPGGNAALTFQNLNNFGNQNQANFG